ncbi:MAG TPA: hypothetical protein VGL61_09350 [Kofleriaceae bacterium]
MWRVCGIMIAVVGGCASDASLIRSDFSASSQCPANQIDVRPAEHHDAYRATGCGFDIHYNCASTSLPDGNGGYPCDRTSLKIIATDDHGFTNDVAGCGQHVRHQISEVGAQPAPGPIGPVRKHKYILIDRYPLTAPPASPAP